MWPFLIAGVLVAGFYKYVVAPNMPSAQIGGPPAKETFTAGGKIKVGDIVTVSMVSVEPNSAETNIDTLADQQAGKTFASPPTEQELSILDGLEAAAEAGGTTDLLVTATGLSKGAVPASIGIIQIPGITTRLPVSFLNASVQRIVRDGKVVT